MRLRKAEAKDSFVRAPEEEERKKIHWGKYIYLVLLAGLLLAIGSCIYRRVVYSSGVGVLRGKMMTVSSSRTGRIESVEVKVGDKVEADQVVARMHLPQLTMDIHGQQQEWESELRDVEHRIEETRRELELAEKKVENHRAMARELKNKLKLLRKVTSGDRKPTNFAKLPDGLSQETFDAVQTLWVTRQKTENARDHVAELKKELSHAQKLFDKGAITGEKTQALENRLADARRTLQLRTIEQQAARTEPRSVEQKLHDQLQATTREQALLETKVSNLQKGLQRARKERKQLREQMKANQKRQRKLARQKKLRAPDRGIITWRGKRSREVAKAGEPIVRIEKRKDLHLKTYFQLSQQPALKTGKKVTIVVPGGERMTGRIRKLAPATADFLKKGIQDIRSREPRVLAEVVPVDGSLDDYVLGTEVTVYLSRTWLSSLPRL